MGVNRISPLTLRLISRVANVVMRIGAPRRVMEMPPARSIAYWHSRIEIRGRTRRDEWRSSLAMMARVFLVSSSWLARGVSAWKLRDRLLVWRLEDDLSRACSRTQERAFKTTGSGVLQNRSFLHPPGVDSDGPCEANSGKSP